MDKLKPCPECGGEFVTLHKKRDKYRYECDDCCCTTAYHWYLTEEEAAAAWNNVERKEPKETTDELKPCPFCGGYAHLDKAYSYYRDIVIYCEGCDTVFTLDDCDATAEDVVNAWNRRAET